ncbi:MAG: agmatinase [Candidatus Rokubacteria bacterium]|nr:agmatinase [Candidatus Rokubacteria bacterium]
MRAVSPRFIACDAPASADARILVYGVPFEGRVNLRKGAAAGPRDVRMASDSIETYSPALGLDLEDLALADAGDVHVPGGSVREALEAIRGQLEAALDPGQRQVFLGGDHTVTVPILQVLAPRHPDLRVVQLDAHPDTRTEFLGEPLNYASALARVMEVIPPVRVYQIGMRTGSRAEFARRGPHFYPATERPVLEAVRWVAAELAGRPVYVTLDIDVLDPAVAPGTGSPEPGGLAVGELVEAIRLLGSLRVVGFDLVEVSPPHDPSGRTGIIAAGIVREAILAWWGG